MSLYIDNYPVCFFWGTPYRLNTSYFSSTGERILVTDAEGSWSKTSHIEDKLTGADCYVNAIASESSTAGKVNAWATYPPESKYDANYLRFISSYKYLDKSLYYSPREACAEPIWRKQTYTYSNDYSWSSSSSDLEQLTWNMSSTWDSTYYRSYSYCTKASSSDKYWGDGLWVMIQAPGGGGGGGDYGHWFHSPQGAGGGGGACALVYLNCRKLYHQYGSNAYFSIVCDNWFGGAAGAGGTSCTSGTAGANVYLQLISGSTTTNLICIGGGSGGACCYWDKSVDGATGGRVTLLVNHPCVWVAGTWAGGDGAGTSTSATAPGYIKIDPFDGTFGGQSYIPNDNSALAGGGSNLGVSSTYDWGVGGGGGKTDNAGAAGGNGFVGILDTPYARYQSNSYKPTAQFTYSQDTSNTKLYRYTFKIANNTGDEQRLIYNVDGKWRGICIANGNYITITMSVINNLGTGLTSSRGSFIFWNYTYGALSQNVSATYSSSLVISAPSSSITV